MMDIAGRGYLWLLQRLHTRSATTGFDLVVEYAAFNRHWDVVHWLVETTINHGQRIESLRAVDIASIEGNLVEAKWLLNKRFDIENFYYPDSECLQEEWPTRREILRCIMEREGYIPEEGLCEAVQQGDLEFVQWLTVREWRPAISSFITEPERIRNKNVLVAMRVACKHGQLAAMQWLIAGFEQAGSLHDLSYVMLMASESGKIELVKWLYEQYSDDPDLDLFRDYGWALNGTTAMDAAASNGHLDVLEFLHIIDFSSRNKRKDFGAEPSRQRDRYPRCTPQAMDFAAENGRLEVVTWLHQNRSEGCTTKAMDAAAENGHLDVVKWLDTHRSEGCTTKAMDVAAVNGHKQYLHSHRSEGCTTDAMDEVAAKGDLEMVQWFRENRSEGCTTSALDLVASTSVHSSYRCCYYSEFKVDMSPPLFYQKQIAILQWMHLNNKVSCTSDAMDGAATNGSLAILQWLQANTTARNTHKAMDNAARNGHLDTVKWLHQQRNSRKRCSTKAMDDAAGNGHLEVVKWLQDNRNEGTDLAMNYAALRGHFKVVAWLLENRYEGNVSSAMENAADRGHLRAVQLLAPHCYPDDILYAMQRAVEHDHFEVVFFLHSLPVTCVQGWETG